MMHNPEYLPVPKLLMIVEQIKNLKELVIDIKRNTKTIIECVNEP